MYDVRVQYSYKLPNEEFFLFSFLKNIIMTETFGHFRVISEKISGSERLSFTRMLMYNLRSSGVSVEVME